WFQLVTNQNQVFVRFDATAPLDLVTPVNPAESTGFEFGKAEPDPYLTVPDSALSQRIGELVKSEIASADSPGGRLRAVQDFLHDRTRYSLRYENEKDLEPLENFLFDERRGHCELYAVSTVLILRHLGIPSRVAYGYHGGQAFSGSRVIAFRNSDFHAWAEVYLDGRGWTVFDTTPVSSGRISAPQPAAVSGALPDFAGYEELGKIEERFSSERTWLSRTIDAVSVFLVRHFITVLIGIGFLIWLVLLFFRRDGGMRHGGSKADGAGALRKVEELPRFAGELLVAGERCGVPKRPSQTWREFLGSLQTAGHCNGEFDEMIDYLYSIRYCHEPRNKARERTFTGVARDFRRAAEPE
ncbi:MAG: transglutaminase domain-containing protein, partial [Verrucomicrobiales bacterium]|nr:transglutaminase domain-containing protein [Verrucomicrobiales bacterium]